MASLLTHIIVGGFVSAAGGLVGGILLLTVRMLFTKEIRVRQVELIRQIGLIETLKKAFLEVPESGPGLLHRGSEEPREISV